MIIIEGLDNTGKSTLADKLHEQYQFEVVRSIGNEKPTNARIMRDCASMMERDALEPFTVHDRGRFISEFIYPPVLKHRTMAISKSAWLMYFEDYITRPQLLIYAIRPLGKVMDTFDKKKQLSGVLENLGNLDEAYGKVLGFIDYMFYAQNNGSAMIYYDWEYTPWEKVEEAVNNYVEVLT